MSTYVTKCHNISINFKPNKLTLIDTKNVPETRSVSSGRETPPRVAEQPSNLASPNSPEIPPSQKYTGGNQKYVIVILNADYTITETPNKLFSHNISLSNISLNSYQLDPVIIPVNITEKSIVFPKRFLEFLTYYTDFYYHDVTLEEENNYVNDKREWNIFYLFK